MGHAGAWELELAVEDSKPGPQQMRMPGWFLEGASWQGIQMQHVVVGECVVSEHPVLHWGQGLLLVLVLQVEVALVQFQLWCRQAQKWLVVHDMPHVCWIQEEVLLDQDLYLRLRHRCHRLCRVCDGVLLGMFLFHKSCGKHSPEQKDDCQFNCSFHSTGQLNFDN